MKRKKGSRKKYPAELRAFALTLNFYSPKAYKYIRKTFKNFLPDLSTIRKWYSVLDGRPGFTHEVFEALKCKVSKSKTPIFCNLVVDEVAIRQGIVYDGKRYYGLVDLGIHMSNDTDVPRQATNALVFMVVALNDHWKVPVGYFLIDALNGKERASLLEKCFEFIYETGVILHSVTFDGAIVNLSMCTALGANFELGNNFKPYIVHNITKEKIFCFFDPCHMLKLVRNTLGDKSVLYYKGKIIDWQNIVSLQKLQETEGLKAGTKLTKRHILYKNSKMNVKLAAQTLSDSVSTALKFCNQYFPNQFKNAEETALFCSIFNDAFDILNVRSKFCKKKKCNMPLTNENYNELKNYAGIIIEYIKQLQYSPNDSILKSNRKTGFLGFIICLTNIFDLFDILKEKGLKYLLTYKINQDHLETFFSALRSRGGFNNNPNAKQFESSYKRLLVRHEIEASERGNCLIDDVQILYASSANKSNIISDGIFTEANDTICTNVFDHDYLSTLWSLSSYIEDVVKYISGFVIRKLLRSNICDTCSIFLTAKSTDSILITLKSRGKLIFPSEDVIKIAKVCETIIRENSHIIFKTKNIKNVLVMKSFQTVCHLVFNDNKMTEHIMQQDIFNNHKTELIQSIIKIYINLRLFHEGKSATDIKQKDFIRQKYSKLIHFKHQ